MSARNRPAAGTSRGRLPAARPPGWRRRRALGGTLGLAVLWAVLAAARPQVTYHLVPALVVWAVPFLYGRDSRRAGLVATNIGLVVAVAIAALLDAMGWLDGPVLFGGTAFGEAVLMAVAATLVAAVVVIANTTGRIAVERKHP